VIVILRAEWKTYHRGCDLSRNVVWDLEGEVLVSTHVRRVTTLGNGTIWVWGTICVNGVWAVVLLVSLAVVASQVSADLGTNTDTVSDPVRLLVRGVACVVTACLLDGLYVLADLNGATNNLVTDTEWERSLTPTTSDGVDIGSADTTSVNGNVNVAVLERLELELYDWLVCCLR